MQNGVGLQAEVFFLVYTLWFASQIEFSDWDWRDLNIISRTIAVITNLMCIWSVPEVPTFQICTGEVVFVALQQPEHNFSSEDNLVGLTVISFIKIHGIFPVSISNCFPHCPRTYTKQWLPKSETQTSSWKKLWVHERTPMEISWWLEPGWQSLWGRSHCVERRLRLG